MSKPYYVSEDGLWCVKVVSFRVEGGSKARLEVFKFIFVDEEHAGWTHYLYFDSIDEIDKLIGLENLEETNVDPRLELHQKPRSRETAAGNNR